MAVRQYGLERTAPQAVDAGVEKRRPLFFAAWRKDDAEACHLGFERLAALGKKRGNLFGRRDIRIVVEIEQLARERARNLAPILDASETIAHGNNVARQSPISRVSCNRAQLAVAGRGRLTGAGDISPLLAWREVKPFKHEGRQKLDPPSVCRLLAGRQAGACLSKDP